MTATGRPSMAVRALVVLAAIAVLAGWFAWAQPWVTPTGTAFRLRSYALITSDPMKVGTRITNTFVQPTVLPGREVVLESVEMIGKVDGLRLLGAEISDPGSPNWDIHKGYPPSARPRVWARYVNVRPIEGATLRGDLGNGRFTFVLGMELAKPGHWWMDALRVTYVENGRRYQQELRLGIATCSPDAANESGECDRSPRFAR